MTAPGTAATGRRTVPDGSTARTARGSWIGLLGSAVNAVAGFALVTVVTHGLGAAAAGSVFTGVAVFTIASNALKLGADTGLVRFVAMDRTATGGRRTGVLLRAAAWPALVAASAAMVALLVLPSAARALLPGLPGHEAVLVLRMFAVFLPLTTVTLVALGAARGYGTVLPFVGTEQIGKPLLRVVLAVPLVVWAPSVLSLSAAWLLPSLAGAVIAWVSLRRLRRGDAPRVADRAGERALVREFWSFSGPRAISSVFDITAVWIGVVLLSLLAGSRDAGVYTAVSRLITAGTLLQLAVRLAVAPQISGLLGSGRTGEARGLHRLSTRWITLFSLPLFVLMAVFPRTVMSLFGGGFPAGAAALVVLCGANAVNVMVGNAQTVILMAGRSSWNLAVAGLAFAVQVGCGLVLIPSAGVLGAAVSWGLAIVVDNLASALLVRYRLGFRTVDRGYAGAVAAGVLPAAVLGLAARGWLGDSVPGVALGCVAAAVVYAAVLWRFRAALGVNDFVGTVGRRG
ncbi:oligosaccharide flippase family protein [Streptomyces sp. SL13]|uniref:Oligosaccharide flippase family protein n=1 Tax=Streptantibioticus silvisoli TaxID=2705255 RepID=A0AA90H1B1_9ACTN|nr:oligosaccharide flippase family protein [Streptantibioticus silvisoli]MDI5964418.1 oligosaccharide flippase family protein [Streptantibioticus silvisoli]MDI5969064.1 oligosaccharide flippase family protein [Streptantibioticus silvisoli]